MQEKYGDATRPSGNQHEGSIDREKSEDGSSSSEDEDDDGFLVTETVDAEISATLQAIKTKDPRVYKQDSTFYSEFDADDSGVQLPKKERPVFLRDYHRKNLLAGDDAEDDTEKPRTYAQQQNHLKHDIVREINQAAAEGTVEEAENSGTSSDEDGGFLIPKVKPVPVASTISRGQRGEKSVNINPADANKDPETFLSNFMAARAWVSTTESHFKPFESDDDEEDQRADDFEAAYNLRFENPAEINEKLMSHSRDLVAKYSVRRDQPTSRRKAREEERLIKEAKKREREEDKLRLRRLKIEEVEEKLAKIKEAAGLRGQALQKDDWAKFINENWDNERWEEEMAKKFGDEYYDDADGNDDEDGSSKPAKKKLKKPKWDDDIDIRDLIPDFKPEEQETHLFTLSDGGDEVELSNVETQEADAEAEALNKKSKSKKEFLQERQLQRKETRIERRLVEELVDDRLDLELPRGSNKSRAQFRYRETSPLTYGLTAHDILMASDRDLNQYAGLKKLAAFRDKEKKQKDKKKLGKKARLRQWRKETFGDENGPRLQLHEVISKEAALDSKVVQVDGRTGEVDTPRKSKKRKRSKKGRGDLDIA